MENRRAAHACCAFRQHKRPSKGNAEVESFHGQILTADGDERTQERDIQKAINRPRTLGGCMAKAKIALYSDP